MQKSTTFTTIFRVKKRYFLYDFACKKVLLSLRYAKIAIYATSCKMSVFFVLDMTRGPTCRVQKNGHFATCFIQDFF
jgi:hypothetical protein